MSQDVLVEVIRKAMIKENRALLYYKGISERTDNKALKEFFSGMAKEEESHFETLNRKLVELKKEGKFVFEENEIEDKPDEYRDSVWTEKLIMELEASSYEASVISVSMSIEESAAQFYTEEAEKADDPRVRAFFKWLAQWEMKHFGVLRKIDDELTERIWFDNQFWPVI